MIPACSGSRRRFSTAKPASASRWTASTTPSLFKAPEAGPVGENGSCQRRPPPLQPERRVKLGASLRRGQNQLPPPARLRWGVDRRRQVLQPRGRWRRQNRRRARRQVRPPGRTRRRCRHLPPPLPSPPPLPGSGRPSGSGESPHPNLTENRFSALDDLQEEDSTGVRNRAGGLGGTQPSKPNPAPLLQKRPNLPDVALVESCERWLEDRCVGGSQTLYWGVIAEAVKIKVLWARFSSGGYCNMPGDAVFRNMLRAAVREQGGEIDEDEKVALPHSCLQSQSPHLKASCLMFLENFHADLPKPAREKAVDAFEAANGSYFAKYKGAEVVVKPISNKFRKALWRFVKDKAGLGGGSGADASNSRGGSNPPSVQPLSLCIQAGGPDGAGVVVTLTVAEGTDEEMPEAQPDPAAAAEDEPMAEAGPAPAPLPPDEPMPAAPESGHKRREDREPAARGPHSAQKSARKGSRDARRSLSRPGTGDPDPIPTPPGIRRSSRESRKRSPSDVHSPQWSPSANSRPRGRSAAPRDGGPMA